MFTVLRLEFIVINDITEDYSKYLETRAKMKLL